MDFDSDPTPFDLRGDWGYWSVKDSIDGSCDLDNPNLRTLEGLYIGAESDTYRKWAKVLPTLNNVEYLVSWTGTNPQPLADAILSMTWLRRLCFGRLGAKDISQLSGLDQLEYLCIHQLAGSKDLRPIGELEKLKVLEVGLNTQVSDLEWLRSSKLAHLRSFISYGANGLARVPSFAPLGELRNVEYLQLPVLDPQDGDLKVLLSLPRLRFVHLRQRKWDQSDIDALQDKGVNVAIGRS